jgi:hypothetical protein
MPIDSPAVESSQGKKKILEKEEDSGHVVSMNWHKLVGYETTKSNSWPALRKVMLGNPLMIVLQRRLRRTPRSRQKIPLRRFMLGNVLIMI